MWLACARASLCCFVSVLARARRYTVQKRPLDVENGMPWGTPQNMIAASIILPSGRAGWLPSFLVAAVVGSVHLASKTKYSSALASAQNDIPINTIAPCLLSFDRSYVMYAVQRRHLLPWPLEKIEEMEAMGAGRGGEDDDAWVRIADAMSSTIAEAKDQ